MENKHYYYDDDLDFIEKFYDLMRIRVPFTLYPYIKSLRRPKAMCEFLTALYLKEGVRIPKHYIDAARYTVLPELQDLAEEVARVILFINTEKESKQKKETRIHNLVKGREHGTKASHGRDNLLKWTNRDAPSDMKDRMEIIATISKTYYRKFRRRKKKSADFKLKPFQIGEDPNSIDYEATVQNIINQGKKIDHLRYEDILFRQLRNRLYCIVLLHDISTSMNRMLFYTNTIVSGLLQVFRDDELSIGLFGEDFYVMKDRDDIEDIDRLSIAVLNLVANGGTMLIRGMDWVFEQLENFSGEVDKICFIISDFKLFSPHLTYEKIKELTMNNVKIIGISTNESQDWHDNTGIPILDISDILKNSDQTEELLCQVFDFVYNDLF